MWLLRSATLVLIASSVPVWAAAASSSRGCHIGRYEVIELPLRPVGINDSGLIAGTTRTRRAALWSSAGGLHELPLPAGFEQSDAVALDNHGRVVGMLHDRGFTLHRPFIFAKGVLSLLPGDHARAFGINDSGEIVGESVLPGSNRSVPVVWKSDGPHAIPTCCGGTAMRIDRAGSVFGDAYDSEGRYYAFRWSAAGGLTRIGPPQGLSSVVASDNHDRVLIEIPGEVFLYTDGALNRLELAPRQSPHPMAMNECGVVVGSYGPLPEVSWALGWDRTTGFVELNARIPSGAGWKLKSATGINNRGAIVGRGDSAATHGAGFLLVPVAD